MSLLIVLVLKFVGIAKVYGKCKGTIESGICFDDQGGNNYVDEKLVSMEFPRRVTITLKGGNTYNVAAVPASFGYFFTKQNITTSEIFMASPETLCQLPDNGDHNYVGKIIIVSRGLCSFEEKSSIAAFLGGTGLIMLNTKDNSPMLMLTNSCLRPEMVTPKWFPVVLLTDTIRSDFLNSKLKKIKKASISSHGKGIGQSCGGVLSETTATAPICAGFPIAHTCNDHSKCDCNGPNYISKTINGVKECVIATGKDPQKMNRLSYECDGHVYPGGTSCSFGEQLCEDFPLVTCQNDVCECKQGYKLVGKPGKAGTKCEPLFVPTSTSFSLDETTLPKVETTESITAFSPTSKILSNVMTLSASSKSQNTSTTFSNAEINESTTMTLSNNVTNNGYNLTSNPSGSILINYTYMATNEDTTSMVNMSGGSQSTDHEDISSPFNTALPTHNNTISTNVLSSSTTFSYTLFESIISTYTTEEVTKTSSRLGSACTTPFVKDWNVCLNMHLIKEHLHNINEYNKHQLQKCLLECYDLDNCCGFHFHLKSGSCVIYSVNETLQRLKRKNGWLFYSSSGD